MQKKMTIGDLISQPTIESRLFRKDTHEKLAAVIADARVALVREKTAAKPELTEKPDSNVLRGGLLALAGGASTWPAYKGVQKYVDNIALAKGKGLAQLDPQALRNGDIVLYGDLKSNALARGFSSPNEHALLYHNGRFIALEGESNIADDLRYYKNKGLTARVYRHQLMTPETADKVVGRMEKLRRRAGADYSKLVFPRMKRLAYDALGLTGVGTQKKYDSAKAVCSSVIAEAFKHEGLNILPHNRPATDTIVTLPSDLANNKLTCMGIFGENNYEKQRKGLASLRRLASASALKDSKRISTEPISRLALALNVAKSPAAKITASGLGGVGALLGAKALLPRGN